MRINFHFENDGIEGIEQAWLLNLLSARNIQKVAPLTLTEQGEVLPLLLNGFNYSEGDGEGISLLETLCISILNAANYSTQFLEESDPELLTAYKTSEDVNISTMFMEDGTCHLSISFSLQR